MKPAAKKIRARGRGSRAPGGSRKTTAQMEVLGGESAGGSMESSTSLRKSMKVSPASRARVGGRAADIGG